MTYALDISQYAPGVMDGPLTDDHVQRCLKRGVDRWCVSILDQDIARAQIEVLARHPVEIQTYRAYQWRSYKAAQKQDVAFIGEIRDRWFNMQKHWIDIEDESRTDAAANIASTSWLIDSFNGICPTGLYTRGGYWLSHMGDTHEFAHVPLWFAHFNGDDSLTIKWPEGGFGGWTNGEMHQTLGDLFVEDVWCDTNYYERVVPIPDPPIDPLKIRLEPVGPVVIDWTDDADVRVIIQKVRIVHDK